MVKKGTDSPPNCIILNSWVLHDDILADELFSIALRSIKTYTCALVKMTYEKISLIIRITNSLAERFKVTSAPFLFMISFY